MITSVIRKYKVNNLYKEKLAPYNPELVKKWVIYINANKPEQAIEAARKMVLTQYPYIPPLAYLNTADNAGININFFETPFGILDFLHWKDMFFIYKKLKEIKNSNENNTLPELIFNFINNEIKPAKYKNDKDRPSFFSEIIARKKGDIIDKYLVYSILTMQASFETQIVILFKENDKNPIYVVAETVLNNKKVVADFKRNKFYNSSLNEVLKDTNFLKSIGLTQNDKRYKLFKTELPAAFYRKNNQRLSKYLKQNISLEIPTFAYDPLEYKENFENKVLIENKYNFILGIEPFLMLKNSKYFPKEWKIKKVDK